MNEPRPNSLGFSDAELAGVGGPRRSWLEEFANVQLPPRRGTPVPTLPMRVGALRVLADPGVIPFEIEIAPGLHLIGEVPDYTTHNASPGLDPVTIGMAIGGAASEVVSGIGDWIAGFFPKAQEAKARGEAAAAVVAAEAGTTINDAENASAISDAKAAKKIALIQARAQAALQGLRPVDNGGYNGPQAFAYLPVAVAPYNGQAPYNGPQAPYYQAPYNGQPQAPYNPAPYNGAPQVAYQPPAPSPAPVAAVVRPRFPDLTDLGGILGGLFKGAPAGIAARPRVRERTSRPIVRERRAEACCDACARSGGSCGGVS